MNSNVLVNRSQKTSVHIRIKNVAAVSVLSTRNTNALQQTRVIDLANLPRTIVGLGYCKRNDTKTKEMYSGTKTEIITVSRRACENCIVCSVVHNWFTVRVVHYWRESE